MILFAKLLCFVLFATEVCRLKAPAQAIPTPKDGATSIEVDKQRLLRTIRFGNRELELPSMLHNAELQVRNDRLDKTIAELQGKDPDLDRLAIDQYGLEQSRLAINIAKVFAQIWSRPDDPDHLKEQFAASDAALDEATERCQVRDRNNQNAHFATLEEAQSACSELQAISIAISKYQLETPHEWPSVFKADRRFAKRVGFRLFVADTSSLKRDRARQVSPDVRKALILGDELLIESDRQIWLQEIVSDETSELNATHPDHPMADGGEVMDLVKKTRQSIAEAGDAYRRAVLNPAHRSTKTK